jgi:hypothetical protein
MAVVLRKETIMPKREPVPAPAETTRKPRGAPDRPERGQAKPAKPAKTKPEDDTKTATDPALLPIGDPAGMA